MFLFRAFAANFAPGIASPAALAVSGMGNIRCGKTELLARHSSDLGAALGRWSSNTRLVPNGISYGDYFWTYDRYFFHPANEIVMKIQAVAGRQAKIVN
jgi:hypothetical protein